MKSPSLPDRVPSMTKKKDPSGTQISEKERLEGKKLTTDTINAINTQTMVPFTFKLVTSGCAAAATFRRDIRSLFPSLPSPCFPWLELGQAPVFPFRKLLSSPPDQISALGIHFPSPNFRHPSQWQFLWQL